jgi:hypothetical protein
LENVAMTSTIAKMDRTPETSAYVAIYEQGNVHSRRNGRDLRRKPKNKKQKTNRKREKKEKKKAHHAMRWGEKSQAADRIFDNFL